MKLLHTEVKFYPEVKSQTGLSSLRVSYKRALKVVTPVSYYNFMLLHTGIVLPRHAIPGAFLYMSTSWSIYVLFT